MVYSANRSFYFTLLILSLVATMGSRIGYGQVERTFSYSINEGLTHPYVLSMLKDSKGFLWVGTYNGLSIYDGYSFREIQSIYKDTSHVKNVRVIYDIVEDEDDIFWIGTEFGLIKYDRSSGSCTRYLNSNSPESISHNHVRTILKSTDGYLYLGTYGGGLNRFDIEKETFISYQTTDSTVNGLQSDHINGLFEDYDGRLWIGTERGIAVLNIETQQFDAAFSDKIRVNDAVNHKSTINTFYQDYYNNLWIGTWTNGLVKYDRKTATFVNYGKGDHSDDLNNNVRVILPADADHLWLGSLGGGVRYFDTQSGKSTAVDYAIYNRKEKVNQTIWNMCMDQNNDLWLATFGDGVYRLRMSSNEFKAYSLDEDRQTLHSNEISVVFEDSQQKIWIGTTKGGLYTFDRESRQFTPVKDVGVQKGNLVYKIIEDRKGNVWIAAGDRLFKVSPSGEETKVYVINDSQNTKTRSDIRTIMEDSYGVLWISSWARGLSLLHPEEADKPNAKDAQFVNVPVSYRDEKSLSHHLVLELYEDKKGDVWIGTADSLNIFKRKTGVFERLDYPSSNSFFEDENGRMWIGGGSGVQVLDSDKNLIHHFSVAEGVEKLAIHSMVEDQLGHLWMGSMNGLIKWDAGSQLLHSYTEDDGLPSNFFHQNAACQLTTGEMLFGTTNGLVWFDSKQIVGSQESLKISITDFKLKNKSVLSEYALSEDTRIEKAISLADTVWLDHEDNVFSMEFAALNAKHPEKVIYRYKLEGFDQDWIVTDFKNRLATYTNLPKEEYLFKVQASYRANQWADTADTLRIYIEPPLWKTTWFRLVFAVVLLSVISIFVLVLIRRARAEYNLGQATKLNENLVNNLKLLKERNQTLEGELSEKNKKMAAMAISSISFSDKMGKMITNLKALKEKLPADFQSKVDASLRSMNKDFDKIKEDAQFNENFNLLYDDFQKRFATAFPKLTHKDVKICAYIRMSKSNVEIAEFLNISPSSIEISRYRIRKKLELPKGSGLNDFILRF